MKVLILGLPNFARKLANDLGSFDKASKYVSLDTYYNKLDKLRFLFHILDCDVVYSVNGSIYGSKTFDLALLLKKRLIMHWVGTDTLKALKKYRSGVVNKDYINKAEHFCEVNWISKELKEMGIEAPIINFVFFDHLFRTKPAVPSTFRILTYVGKNREDFYGLDKIENLAVEFPDIPISIIGISSYKTKLPRNISLLGWVEDMGELINKHILCLRLTEHDGLSSFVLESLTLGRHVAYNNDFSHCEWINEKNTLSQVVSGLKEAFDSDRLGLNEEGMDFVRRDFSREKILTQLIQILKMKKS